MGANDRTNSVMSESGTSLPIPDVPFHGWSWRLTGPPSTLLSGVERRQYGCQKVFLRLRKTYILTRKLGNSLPRALA
jgi:hypothetical protein